MIQKYKNRSRKLLRSFLFKEAADDNLFRLFLAHSEGHELYELVVIDFADSRLMDYLRIG